MNTFEQINKIGNPLGIYAKKLPNFNPSCPDVTPKYELDFEDTKAVDAIGQSSYMSGDMKQLNEDFNEVLSLCDTEGEQL